MEPASVEGDVRRLFGLVREALAKATSALLDRDKQLGTSVIHGDCVIDRLTAQVEDAIWDHLSCRTPDPDDLRSYVAVLLILPELERSADLAEHIAQRALTDIGAEMSPVSRGIVDRMSRAAIGMWRIAADAYSEQSASAAVIDEADEELDVLHARLDNEVAAGTMPPAVGAQVALLSRFYERLGDHAVNLTRRIEALHRGQAVPTIARESRY